MAREYKWNSIIFPVLKGVGQLNKVELSPEGSGGSPYQLGLSPLASSTPRLGLLLHTLHPSVHSGG